MRTTALVIEGMHCDGCAATIETLLGRVPGVRKADVSFAAAHARILHDTQASSAGLVAAIERAGFSVSVVEP